jgi:hypothetical protein
MNNKDLSFLNDILTKGYIRVPRAILADLFCKDEKKHQEANLYLFLLSSTFYKKGDVHKLDKEMVCQRGQFICSQSELEEVFELSRRQVRLLLSTLVQRNLIEVEVKNHISHISIVHYDSIAGTPSKPTVQKKAEQKVAAEKPCDTKLSYKNHPMAHLLGH